VSPDVWAAIDDAVRRQRAAEAEGLPPQPLSNVERRQLLRHLPWHVRVRARLWPGTVNYGSSAISLPVYRDGAAEDDQPS
jgi:hypothetical protein